MMQTILKLKSDGAHLALMVALLAACLMNVMFVGAWLLTTVPGREPAPGRAALSVPLSVRMAAASDPRHHREITR